MSENLASSSEAPYCKNGLKYCGAERHTKNSNIYNAVAERPPENNVFFYWLTPNAPLKILGKNRFRRTDNSEILKTNILY